MSETKDGKRVMSSALHSLWSYFGKVFVGLIPHKDMPVVERKVQVMFNVLPRAARDTLTLRSSPDSSRVTGR